MLCTAAGTVSTAWFRICGFSCVNCGGLKVVIYLFIFVSCVVRCCERGAASFKARVFFVVNTRMHYCFVIFACWEKKCYYSFCVRVGVLLRALLYHQKTRALFSHKRVCDWLSFLCLLYNFLCYINALTRYSYMLLSRRELACRGKKRKLARSPNHVPR